MSIAMGLLIGYISVSMFLMLRLLKDPMNIKFTMLRHIKQDELKSSTLDEFAANAP